MKTANQQESTVCSPVHSAAVSFVRQTFRWGVRVCSSDFGLEYLQLRPLIIRGHTLVVELPDAGFRGIEIDQLESASSKDHYVFRFYVPMNEAAEVQVLYGDSQLCDQYP